MKLTNVQLRSWMANLNESPPVSNDRLRQLLSEILELRQKLSENLRKTGLEL